MQSYGKWTHIIINQKQWFPKLCCTLKPPEDLNYTDAWLPIPGIVIYLVWGVTWVLESFKVTPTSR